MCPLISFSFSTFLLLHHSLPIPFLLLLFPSSLCSKLQIDTEMDSAYLLETLAGNFMDVVQYNEDNRGFEVGESRHITNISKTSIKQKA